MRILFLVFLGILVSCGQSTTSSGDKSERPNRQEEEYVTNIREVDLLDVSIDVPVEITSDKIIFKKTTNHSLDGVRSSCSVDVTEGQSYGYALRGNRLEIFTSGRDKLSFARVGAGNGIVGSWTWRGYQGETLVIRRMSFVSENRLIMRAHCENQ